jgi:hypothetical protein
VGEVEKIGWNEMWAAVRIVERHFNDKERFIRDCFDAFFGHMQIIEHYLNIDLIDLADVVYPFDYYLYALDKNAFMFDNFVGAYHSRAASFILRLREFEEKKKPAAQPDAEAEEVTPPADEEEEASESEEVAAEPCAYFLFDCPPRKERFVLCLEDPKKIAEARAILNDEAERHVHGTLVDSPIFYNEPWRFHVEPSSVNFYDTALDFAEEVNGRVEAQLGPMGKAAFPANDIWHVGGARLLAQLPASRFSDESAAKENEERSMLSGMGRLADAASEM